MKTSHTPGHAQEVLHKVRVLLHERATMFDNADAQELLPQFDLHRDLFSAAPDLLAEMRFALEYLESPPFIALHGEMPANRARAAILKAEASK